MHRYVALGVGVASAIAAAFVTLPYGWAHIAAAAIGAGVAVLSGGSVVTTTAVARATTRANSVSYPPEVPPKFPGVMVNWAMSETEWTQLEKVLLMHTDVPYINALYRAGKLGPVPPASLPIRYQKRPRGVLASPAWVYTRQHGTRMMISMNAIPPKKPESRPKDCLTCGGAKVIIVPRTGGGTTTKICPACRGTGTR